MTSKDYPTLVSGLVPDRFFPPAIARTTATIPTTALGANSGVAQLDADGHLKYAHMAPGGVLYVRWNGSWPATRPTSRTDIQVRAEAPSTINSPATIADAPSWLINGDTFEIVADTP